MAIKVGDKVKFLNDKGGGIVSRIIDSRLVSVAIEGGFEIPVQASELIVINKAPDAGSRLFQESFDVEERRESSDRAESQASVTRDIPATIIKSRKSEDIYMAFSPHDQKWLITGQLDVFLVNNTSWDVLYNHFQKIDDFEWKGIDYGSMPANSTLLVATIDRDDLPVWTDGRLQFLFHKEQCSGPVPPYNADFTIPGKKFYSEQGYKESLFIAGKAVVVRILSLNSPIEEKSKTQIITEKTGKQKLNSDDFILKHRTGEKEAVVDLHMHELVEDQSGFEKVEILEYQKNYFIRCLESAMVNGFRKVTFIHGVGNGVLREVIMDILKKQEGIEVFDAPMQKYGVGAVEIHVRHNR